MIKLLGAALAAAAVAFSSCNSVSDYSYADPYADIRPGMSIYNSVTLQNTVATDPAAVAVRLAMLTEEAAAKKVSINEVTVKYNGRDQNLKSLLFGSSVDIQAKSSKDEGYADGDYLIRYRTFSAAQIDTFKREGDYLVHTGGKKLSEATEAEPWSVEIASQDMRLSSATTSYRMKPQGTLKLYRQPDGHYRLDFEQLATWFEGYEEYTSDWTGNFFWKPSSITDKKPSSIKDDWSFTARMKDSYTLYGQAQGATFYSFNSQTPTRMSYRAETMNPVEWQPDKTGSSTLKTSGIETCRLTHPTDYSIEAYPASTVQVSRKVTDNTIITTVLYNGKTINL